MSKYRKTCTRDIKISDSPPSPPSEKDYGQSTSKYHVKCTQNEIKTSDSPPPSPPPEKDYGHSATSKYHKKCKDDEFHKNKPVPEEVEAPTSLPEPIEKPVPEEVEAPPSRPKPIQIQKTYSHGATSKYHVKCTEDEFHKKKPIPSPPPSPPEEEEEEEVEEVKEEEMEESIQFQKRSSLLDVLRFGKKRDCACDLVAHACRSHVHMNLGLQEKRDEINGIRRRSADTIQNLSTEAESDSIK